MYTKDVIIGICFGIMTISMVSVIIIQQAQKSRLDNMVEKKEVIYKRYCPNYPNSESDTEGMYVLINGSKISIGIIIFVCNSRTEFQSTKFYHWSYHDIRDTASKCTYFTESSVRATRCRITLHF